MHTPAASKRLRMEGSIVKVTSGPSVKDNGKFSDERLVLV